MEMNKMASEEKQFDEPGKQMALQTMQQWLKWFPNSISINNVFKNDVFVSFIIENSCYDGN